MKNIGTKVLETERLILRKANVSDANDMYNNWGSDPLVSKYVTWETHKSVEDSLDFLKFLEESYTKDNTYQWLVVLKEDNTPIGSISAVNVDEKNNTIEIGYCYGRKWWGNGYATEAFKRVISFLFEEVEAETIYARYLLENPASGKVMEKSGLAYEGTLRNRILDKNKVMKDIASYSITKEDYLKNK